MKEELRLSFKVVFHQQPYDEHLYSGTAPLWPDACLFLFQDLLDPVE